ncbi:hypothetical protein [Vibrio sp. Hep-1b-8]|uniref:hypothetical protein n=1 Tax=Vibrio sp. Hep-1b-8 TaxID=2144187 RepID=UPI003211F1B9
MGDPWAMGVLSGYEYYVNNPCGYLGWPCDDKWYQLAVDGWKKEAETGNGKALLQLQFFTNQWRNYVPVLGRYLIDKKYIEALTLGGLNASYYLTRFSDVPREEKIKYLKIAANQGYAPCDAVFILLSIRARDIGRGFQMEHQSNQTGLP